MTPARVVFLLLVLLSLGYISYQLTYDYMLSELTHNIGTVESP